MSSEEAVAQARSQLGVDEAVAGRAWLVRRLDRPAESYYLVIFGSERAAVGVASVAADSGDVLTSARLPGSEPHVAVDAKMAIDLSGLSAVDQVALVWRPCRASRSPLYPIWEIGSGDKTVYVDQQGGTWQRLEGRGPGG